MLRDRNPVQFMRQVDREDPDTHDFVPGEWREGEVLVPLHPLRNPRAMVGPKNVRAYLMDYYSTRGTLDWQDRIVDE